MAGRRQHIPYQQRYAAALVELLHPDIRSDLIKRKASIAEIERWVVIDHNITVKTKEIVKWWNLNLFIKDKPTDHNAPAHVAKTARDAKVHAKADRFARLATTGSKKTEAQKKRSRPFPKSQSKIPSRPFPKRPK